MNLGWVFASYDVPKKMSQNGNFQYLQHFWCIIVNFKKILFD
jgi:hypothetical protein